MPDRPAHPVAPFELTATLRRGDLTRALRSFPRVNRRRWLAFAVMSAFWLALLLGSGGGVANAVIFGVLFAVSTVVSLGAPWVVPLRSRQAIGIGREMRWAFGPRGVTLTSSLGSTDIPWTGVADLRAGGDGGALLLRGPRMVFALPQGMSPEQAAAVRAWWERSGQAPAEAPAEASVEAPAGAGAGAPHPERVVARGTPTAAQAVALQRMARSLQAPRRLLALPGFGALASGVMFFVGVPADRRAELAPIVPVVMLAVALLVAGAIAAGGVLSRLLAPLVARGLPRRIWGDEPVTWWFEPGGLGIDSRASSAVPWSRVRELRLRAGLLVVVLEPHMVLGVPLEAFAPGDAARALELARVSGAPVRGSLPPAVTVG
jgi:hypothetical protein